jgi:phosphoadenosine phosphosulfate reductase
MNATANHSEESLDQLAFRLERLDALGRVRAVVERWDSASAVVTTSFGLQSAVLLHLVSRVAPGLKVLFVDTGYHFPETLDYAETLRRMLGLNLSVYRPLETPEVQEARWGRLWELGEDGLGTYNYFNKVEPLERAFDELGPRVWLSGLRRVQSESRRFRPVLEEKPDRGGVVKVYPIIDWSDKDVFFYQQEHGLPDHPLWAKGYVSVGDRHSSEPLRPGQAVESTRFSGVKRECGIHL